MKKNSRVFIIHGWGGYPEEGWLPWLKTEAEKSSFEVQVPAMPDTDHPQIEKWVSFLSKTVDEPTSSTYLVGHSIGCQTILRYAEKLPRNFVLSGAVFVAGWFTLKNIDSEEDKAIAKPWLETPIDFNLVKKHLEGSIAIFSDNDPVVPLGNKDKFRRLLGSEIVTEKGKSHFSGDDNITKLPSALSALLKLSKD